MKKIISAKLQKNTLEKDIFQAEEEIRRAQSGDIVKISGTEVEPLLHFLRFAKGLWPECEWNISEQGGDSWSSATIVIYIA